MRLRFSQLTAKNPYLLHLTYRPSLARIRRTKTLDSAATMLEQGGLAHMIRERRVEMLPFAIGDDEILLTDQLPLTEGQIEFRGEWGMADLVEAINRRVFFWRANKFGLLKKDQRHFATYEQRGKNLVFLRIPLIDAVSHPRNYPPEYCRFNSGGPRCSGGNKSPRGPSTFVKAEEADFTFGKIREVVFLDSFHLPTTTEICFEGWGGPWSELV